MDRVHDDPRSRIPLELLNALNLADIADGTVSSAISASLSAPSAVQTAPFQKSSNLKLRNRN